MPCRSFLKKYTMCDVCTEQKSMPTAFPHVGSYSLPSFAKSTPKAGITITGNVFDDLGNPISGAHVLVSDTKGVVTNHHGEFTLTGLSPDDTVLISHVSYLSVSMQATDNFDEVQLEEGMEMLNEIEIIGDKKTPAKEPFNWNTVFISLGIAVASGIIIRKLTQPKVVKTKV